ncbi:MAG: hypothetical protein IT158_10765, partial [Bryobacterales bacterium]|nr:hypothetical protein [Bryobacterales bacterium]
LPRSADVPGDLARLGLDPGEKHRVGTHAYSPGSPFEYPVPARQFAGRLSLTRIALYYAGHPATTWQILRDALHRGSLLRADRQGNYDRGAGRPPYAMSYYFALWSIAKYQVLGRRPVAYLMFFLIPAGVLAAMAARRRLPPGMAGAALVMAAMAAVELAIGTLGDAAEITRHLTIYNFLSDVLFVAALAALVYGAGSRR